MKKEIKIETNDRDDEEKISIRLPKQLKDDLEAYCDENGIKKSVFIRDALSSMLYGVESKMNVSTVGINKQIEKEKKEIEHFEAYLKLLTLKEEKTKIMEEIAKKSKANDAAFGNK